MSRNKADACLPFACRLQSCLERSSYDQERCDAEVRAIVDCCELHWQSSVPCDGFRHKLRSYRSFLQQQQQQQQRQEQQQELQQKQDRSGK